jgi:3-isopropylmalate/(R)-2-methylmalate dehydratase small subunit
MRAFTRHDGLAAPLDRANIDTDQIIPKQFLKSIHRRGFGANLFDQWRYLDPGSPGQDPARRRPNPEFVLNLPRYQGASILVTRANFGCGSSREHAPWALDEFGIRALIAPSFAEIFNGNCLKNGLLPVVLDEAAVEAILSQLQAQPGYRLTVDLEAQAVTTPAGEVFHFDVDPFRRQCLLNGWDDIALTLRHSDRIREFEARRLASHPWLACSGAAAGAGR